MSSLTTSGLSTGVYLLLVSVALNGILAGVIISKKAAPAPATQGQQIHMPRSQALTMSADPRRILRHLSPERRRIVLKKAMQAVPKAEKRQFRRLRASLHKAEQAVFSAANTDEFNAATLRQALAVLGSVRTDLGKASDALMINIWAELTPQERKTSLSALQTRQKRHAPTQRGRRQKQD